MKLHYSQTPKLDILTCLNVLLPYEITLFSNGVVNAVGSVAVLLPYEITLFSNCMKLNEQGVAVLLPYEITLFSNWNLSTYSIL